MSSYVWGVDVGATTIKLGLVSESGELPETWEVATDTTDGGRNVLSDIRSSLFAICDGKNLPWEKIAGVGIAVPGAVLPDGSVNRCVNIGWGRVDLEKEFTALLSGTRVAALNDANAAALGEMWQGAGRGVKNLCMVTLGTGVGGGIIADGRPFAGEHGAAGEIGHICVRPDEEEVCSCGKRGCLEQYTAMHGLVRQAGKLLAETDEPSVLRSYGEKLSPRRIFDAAREGDGVACRFAEAYGRDLGLGLSIVAAVFDPERFVIGGGISAAGEVLFAPTRKYYREFAFHASRDAEIVPAELGNRAGIIGAAYEVIERSKKR